MNAQTKRITIIARPDAGARDWQNAGGTFPKVLIDSYVGLKAAVATCADESIFDIDRVLIDRAASSDEFLSLLSALPPTFLGDALFIREGGDAYLSATARGGSRVLYALSARDVGFYLEVHGLVPSAPAVRIAAHAA